MSSSSLPSALPKNEWRAGHELRISDSGHVTLPGFGVRHTSELEFAPSRAAFPNCWVKLLDSVAAISDEVVEEKVLYSHKTAQSDYRRFLTDIKATATQKGVAKKKTSMFIADPATPFPFTGKALEANLKRWREKKDKPPVLKESESLSLLCPADRPEWAHCDRTFRPEKLEATVAQKQFGVALPLLPDNLIKVEFEARSRLALIMGASTMTEAMISLYPISGIDHPRGSDALKLECAGYWARLVAKSQFRLVLDAIAEFGDARRACRTFVFKQATVRQEPDRLIESSIWGEFLFPEDLVKEVKDEACKQEKALLRKWGFPDRGEKRKGTSSDWKSSSKKQKMAPPSTSSPASNLKFDSQADQSFRWKKNKGKAGNKGGQKSSSTRPSSSGQQQQRQGGSGSTNRSQSSDSKQPPSQHRKQ